MSTTARNPYAAQRPLTTLEIWILETLQRKLAWGEHPHARRLRMEARRAGVHPDFVHGTRPGQILAALTELQRRGLVVNARGSLRGQTYWALNDLSRSTV